MEKTEAFFSKPSGSGGLSKLSDDDLNQVAGDFLVLMEKSGLNKDQVIVLSIWKCRRRKYRLVSQPRPCLKM